MGPPGVGKTSLAKSIARATNRKFVRLSLGGVRDEAEIRGHRRTYIGAFPGQIIQMMKKAGSRNPVFLLDEVDKMSMDFRGDPSAALLEVLDPEQNHSFTDHYLDVEYDLSSVFFIATANVLHTIPQPLQDRMEVLRLPGYTEREKVEIAKRHLIPKQIESHGLEPRQHVASPTSALPELIRRYTREAGVRNMEREISSDLPQGRAQGGAGGQGLLGRGHATRTSPTYLGVPRYRASRQEERNEIGHGHRPGLDRGGRRDPAHRGHADARQGRAHAHRQAGRRDAGVGAGRHVLGALAGRASSASPRTSTASSTCTSTCPRAPSPRTAPRPASPSPRRSSRRSCSVPVRRDVAMTGEITLRGKVLPIGGVKEKLLAAHRIGVTTIILPRENEKDLADVPKVVLDTHDACSWWSTWTRC